MGVFSDNYFDLLSEANAIEKGNKGDELWSEKCDSRTIDTIR